MMKAEQKVLKRFNKGCVDYRLLEDGDHILIALSGGKDSLELVRLLAQRARIYKPHIEVEAAHIIMDNIPYETDRSYLQDFCAENGIKLHILHSSFDESTDPRKTRCFLCAWNRRKTLFEFAVSQPPHTYKNKYIYIIRRYARGGVSKKQLLTVNSVNPQA